LIYLEIAGQAVFGHAGFANVLLLVGTGIVTVVPLLLFAGAANRIKLTAIGLLQYITPTMSFMLGVFVFREPMPLDRLLGFALVWVAIAIFTWDGISRARALRTRAVHTVDA
ncbi:MAG TPA: EamA family transporter RarD, partial [Actinopolymorphaceae bacterium]